MTNQTLQVTLGAYARIFASDEKTPLTLTPKVRLSLVRNMRALREAAKDVQEARDGLIRTHSMGGTSIDPGSAGWEAFVADAKELSAASTDITLEPVSITDLNFEVNSYPLAVMEFFLSQEEVAIKQ